VLSPGPPPSARDPFAHATPSGQAGGGGRATLQLVRGRRVPLVQARIAGQPTLLLVDTGAYDHLLEGWFARVLQDADATGRSATVVDHANRTVVVDRWSQVSFIIDGWNAIAPIRPLVTGDASPGPRALGIGGILSPQRLALGGASVVLDFPSGAMTSVDEATATAQLDAHPTSLGAALRCGATFAIDATIEGKGARLLVDTGAFSTDLKATSAPGRALAGRTSVSARDIYAVGGAVATRTLGDAELKIGRLSVKLDIPLVLDHPRAARCPSDGVLGMDVLEKCVLVVDEMKMRIACD